jgi:hypothetical protein
MAHAGNVFLISFSLDLRFCETDVKEADEAPVLRFSDNWDKNGNNKKYVSHAHNIIYDSVIMRPAFYTTPVSVLCFI